MAVSKYEKYSEGIKIALSQAGNKKLGYTELARKILDESGDNYSEHDVNVFRTYIRRNFSVPSEQPKIMIYDIETSRMTFKRFWTGKQYVSYRDMIEEPSIITVAWKWLGEDQVNTLTWDSKHSDKGLMESFMPEFNKADLVIGVNNNNFDNRWIAARAMKYGIDYNNYVKSFDLLKHAKRVFRLPSYSMDFMTKFAGITNKQSHEGIVMWDKIESGTEEEQKEYLQKMIDYNIGDIAATEAMYVRFKKYFKSPLHKGVSLGSGKSSCSCCGGSNIELYQTQVSPAGTISRIMICLDDRVKFKISNSDYLKYIETL